jgi:WS/DGAT/MGAT family acyltransferase
VWLAEHSGIAPKLVTHTRLSPLDASFLAAETATAHMHVGWVALFDPPADGVTFEQLRDHVEARLQRAPRYRQKLAGLPWGLDDPLWVDDERFDIAAHVFHAEVDEIRDLTDAILSVPLPRDRPLWQLWIADELADGRIAVIGKVHHCMVDGLAAADFAALLLDTTPIAPPEQCDDWHPTPAPGRLGLLAATALHAARWQLDLALLPVRALGSPSRLTGTAERAGQAFSALGDSLRPAGHAAGINQPISADRLLTLARRPLADLRTIASRHGVTLNDVVLATCAGAVGSFLEERGEPAVRLKAMVPVNMRGDGDAGAPGNHIACMFVDLPCDVPDPVLRLKDVSSATRARKRAREAEGTATLFDLLALLPPPLKRLASRLGTSPRTFNLIVSNVPGPEAPLYLCGCELREAYPVVPLADHHGLSIGFTSVRDQGCFGIYADRGSLGDTVLLPEDIDDAIEELLRQPASVPQPRATPPESRPPALV